MSFFSKIGSFIQHSGIDPVKSSIKRPLEAGKDLIHGHPGKAFQDLRHIVSDNEKAQSKGMADYGLRGWVGKHPLETAAAVVATVFSGGSIWGAWGAGASGAAGSAAGGATAAGAGTAAVGGSGAAAGTGAMGMATSWSAWAGGASGASSAAGTASAGAGLSTFGASGTAATSALASNAAAGTGALGMTTGYGAYASGTAASSMGAGVASGGSMGAGSGFAGSSVPSSSGSMTWQDWVQQGNRANNMLNKGQQDQYKPDPVELRHPELSLSRINVGQGNSENGMMPNSTSDIINQSGNNQSFGAQSFGANY